MLIPTRSVGDWTPRLVEVLGQRQRTDHVCFVRKAGVSTDVAAVLQSLDESVGAKARCHCGSATYGWCTPELIVEARSRVGGALRCAIESSISISILNRGGWDVT